MSAAVPGPDGRPRCPWALSTPDYLAYHDEEWGVPVHGESALFERLTLEAFQSGLSWLTILRKRPAFRSAFAGFDADAVAAFDHADRERLMADAAIVRNRAKIDAAIANAAAIVRLRERVEGGLDALVWAFAERGGGDARATPPADTSEIPSATPASKALATTLKKHGFVFIGPTTAYAAMQACGLVDDHLAGCVARGGAGDRG